MCSIGMYSRSIRGWVQCTRYMSVLMCSIGMYSRLIRGWVQCTRYMSVLMCSIGMYSRLIRGWVQCTRYMSVLMCSIGMYSRLIRGWVQCTRYMSVLMCSIGMYSRLIRGWVQCTRYMSGLMCDIVFQWLIRDGGTIYSEYFWVDAWYRYSVIDSQFGTVYLVTCPVRHMVIMVWNGIQRLTRGGVQCTRYSSTLTRGEYGMEWWQAIDSQLGTDTRYMSGLTCGELDAHDRVWYSGYWSMNTSALLVVRASYSSGI